MIRTLSIVILTLGFSTMAQANERLSNEELKAFYSDKTLVGVHWEKGPGRGYFGADGSFHEKRDNGTENTGKWWIDEANNSRCLHIDGNPKAFCHPTVRKNDGTHALVHFKSGKVLVEFKEALPGKQF